MTFLFYHSRIVIARSPKGDEAISDLDCFDFALDRCLAITGFEKDYIISHF